MIERFPQEISFVFLSLEKIKKGFHDVISWPLEEAIDFSKKCAQAHEDRFFRPRLMTS